MQSITWREDFKFLFDFLNSQTRQTNGSFKSCNSHINACRDAASTESKCLYSWLDSGMQIWDQQPGSGDDEAAESTSELAMSVFTDAMEKLNPVATGTGRVSPLTFQLKSTWEEAKEHEKEICIDNATEACTLVCDIIAPKAGQQLFQACFTGTSYLDLLPLMQAYSNAITSTLKTQILSLYTYRYPVKTLQKIHEPYAKLSE